MEILDSALIFCLWQELYSCYMTLVGGARKDSANTATDHRP
jgi:hypothetical protein